VSLCHSSRLQEEENSRAGIVAGAEDQQSGGGTGGGGRSGNIIGDVCGAIVGGAGRLLGGVLGRGRDERDAEMARQLQEEEWLGGSREGGGHQRASGAGQRRQGGGRAQRRGAGGRRSRRGNQVEDDHVGEDSIEESSDDSREWGSIGRDGDEDDEEGAMFRELSAVFPDFRRPLMRVANRRGARGGRGGRGRVSSREEEILSHAIATHVREEGGAGRVRRHRSRRRSPSGGRRRRPSAAGGDGEDDEMSYENLLDLEVWGPFQHPRKH